MKSPREILLQRHDAVMPKLDRIREQLLAGELRPQAASARQANTDPDNIAFGFALKLWRELIGPCRQVWGALAAVWLLLAVFELATRSDAPQAHPLAYASLPTSMPLSFAEQEYWINELTQLRSRPPVKPPSEAPPKPRSEGLAAWRIT